ncbi:MAG: T9SS type B sorting domain-containing protein [Bacteroidota bacterium]
MKVSLQRKTIYVLLFWFSGFYIFYGQTIGPDFTGLGYTIDNLGNVGTVPPRYGGIEFKYDNPNELLIGGDANFPSGALYKIGLARDPLTNNIIGFTDNGSYFADAADSDEDLEILIGGVPVKRKSSIDGGLDYGPDNVLFFPTWHNSWLLQIRDGETAISKAIDLEEDVPGWTAHEERNDPSFGEFNNSASALQFVPCGFPGAGRLKIATWPIGYWYDFTVTPDGSGTFDITLHNETLLGQDTEGFVYVAKGAPGFDEHSILIGSYTEGIIYAYDIDNNGDPIFGTKREFISGIDNYEGAAIDPLTGDFLFVDWGGANELIIVRGFPPPRFGNTISADQTICPGDIPLELREVLDSDSQDLERTYQWQESTDGISFSDISGSTGSTYQPPPLHTTTYYQLTYRFENTDPQLCGSEPLIAGDMSITITTQSLAAGEIAEDQTLLFGTLADPLTELSPATSSETVSHQWQSRTESGSFGDISGATGNSYSPGLLTENTYFRRVDTASPSGCFDYTNTVYISFSCLDTAPEIGTEQTICSGEVPDLLQQTAVPTVPINYRWQQSTNGVTFDYIIGEESESYQPPALFQNTWYRMEYTISGADPGDCLPEYTSAIIITVASLDAGQIGQLEQTILAGSTANQIIETAPFDASPGETVTHQWERGPSQDGDFEPIPGANNPTYDPGVLLDNTWFRRVDTSFPSGCSHITNEVLVRLTCAPPAPSIETHMFSCNDQGLENAVEIMVSANGYTFFEFLWDNNTPNDTSDDIVLQQGDSPIYIEERLARRRIIIKMDSGFGCTETLEVILEERLPLEAQIVTEQDICTPNTAQAQVTIQGGLPPYFVQLNNGLESQVGIERVTYGNLDEDTDYTISVRDSNNCTISLSASFAPIINLDASVEIDYFCYAEGAGHTNLVSLSLAKPDELDKLIFTLDGEDSSSETIPEFTDLTPGRHSIALLHAQGCMETLSFEIEEIPSLTLELFTPGTGILDALGSGGVPPYVYRLDNSRFSPNSRFRITQTGTYTVTVQDSLGCEASQDIFLEILPIIVPNFFTPDNDMTNDSWRPKNIEQYPMARTKIFDRYGRHLVTLFPTDGWDGQYNGGALPSGDYWYIIELNGEQTINEVPVLGHFTLYR